MKICNFGGYVQLFGKIRESRKNSSLTHLFIIVENSNFNLTFCLLAHIDLKIFQCLVASFWLKCHVKYLERGKMNPSPHNSRRKFSLRVNNFVGGIVPKDRWLWPCKCSLIPTSYYIVSRLCLDRCTFKKAWKLYWTW